MNILFVAAEMAPYAKVGGLADVMAALPRGLAQAGHSVSVVLPLYRSCKTSGQFQQTKMELNVPAGGKLWGSKVWQGSSGPVALFALQCDEYFDRAHPYGEGGEDYGDSLARFQFLARGAVELARHIEPVPEVIHANDWHTALVPAYVQALKMRMRTVFTIHNLRYQGSFSGEEFAGLGLPGEMFRPEGLEFYGRTNWLKGAVCMADAVTTVSPTYALEIQEEAKGCGLHEVLRGRKGQLTGILNGIDEAGWNPAKDGALRQNFRWGAMGGREACRVALEEELGLEPANGRPIFGMVTRLAEEKGVEQVWEVAEELVKKGGRLAVLGTGEKRLEEAGRQLAKKHPQKVAVRVEHNEELARRIFSGADFFLMPSRSEPCGLTQMYAMRYGAIPVVSDTGGLHDTVEPWSAATGQGVGFRFSPAEAGGLGRALDQALALWDQPAMMKKVRQNGMNQKNGWESVVPVYERLYRSLLGNG